MLSKIDKKIRLFVLSLVVSLCVLGFWMIKADIRWFFGGLSFVVAIAGTFLALYPSVQLKSVVYILILPLHFIVGVLLSILGYPNLSLFFVFSFSIIFGFIFYIIYLVNNVFLVVEEKSEVIPLYRVALTWSQIILILVAIPYFSGVFKISTLFYLQNLVLAVSAFLFSIYLMWTVHYDSDIKKVERGERVAFSLFVAFVVFSITTAVSFIPTESFLKAIFCASVLLSVLGYIYNHYINRITKGLMWEYLGISAAFFFILLLFIP